jgi:ankyrin repeat protein
VFAPLHIACHAKSNRVEIAKVLVNANANVNRKSGTIYNYTPAHRCAWNNESGVMRVLIDSGANLDIRVDGGGDTPL